MILTEQVLRQLVNAMPNMVLLASVDGNCTFVSERWLSYTGIEASKQLRHGWQSQLHQEDRARVQAAWNHAVSFEQEFTLQCRVRRHDDVYRWVETRATTIKDERSNILNWLVTITDIHEPFVSQINLAEQEERFRYAARATHDAVYDWDSRRGMIYCNELYQKQFGPHEPLAADDPWWRTRIHPNDFPRVVASLEAASRSQRSNWSEEYRLMQRDGQYVIVNDRAYLIYDENEKLRRLIGALTDVTARRNAEQSLRDARAGLVAAMEAGGLAVWTWDMIANQFTWDENTCRLWGRHPNEFRTLSYAEIFSMIHEDDRAALVYANEVLFESGRLVPIEFRTLRPDGALQWLTASGQCDRDPTGKFVRMSGVYLDITERIQVEQSLRDTQARLKSAMQAAGLATWIWDIANDVLTWDEDAYRMWGRTPGEFPSLTYALAFSFTHPDDRATIVALSEEFKRTGVEMPVEFRVVLPDKSERWIMTRAQVEHNSQGVPQRMVGVYIDITERKRAEQMRLNSQKMEALGTLAGGIAHDFNNILLAITGNAKLALSDLPHALQMHPIHRNLVEIEKASVRAADLVKRILTFSRKDESQFEIIGLRPLIEDSLQLLRPTLPATIEINSDLALNVPPVACESIQIQQVVMNLLTNAAHAIGDGSGSVTIALRERSLNEALVLTTGSLNAGRYVCLTVSDSGSGIDNLLLERIFEPFFTTKRVGQGTGLGLAVVHGIVQGLGGAIGVESSRASGTTFSVYLPVASEPATPVQTRRKVMQVSQGARVLYVDDEEPLVFLISRVLERLGYRVTGFVDPDQALQELRDKPQEFDVVVTDLSMRGMNGFDLTRVVQSIRGDLPVLLTSGYLRSEDRELASKLGIRELILKPNTVEELGEAIDRTLAAIAKSAG